MSPVFNAGRLHLQHIAYYLSEEHHVVIGEHDLRIVNNSFAFLERFVAGKLIYGINTGFGPMAQYTISSAEAKQLQMNLIRSHSSGMGDRFSPLECRVILLTRLNTVLLGGSGIHEHVPKLMVQLLNNKAYPCIHKHGGVGASGDLVQLAHLALGLLGEGEFWWNGQYVPAQTVFKELGLQPMNIHIREGIALMNGTSAMTGLALLNLLTAKRIVLLTTLLSTLINEIMEAYDDHFSLLLNNAKLHEGQRTVARWMRNLSSSGSLLRNRAQHLYSALPTETVVKDQVQEVYSVRCVPQIVGAVVDTLATAEKVVVNELNSVNDNPVIDAANEQVLHGGNFHGDYISLEMDKLKLAMAKLSMLAERQLNFLLNPAINKKLPAFLNVGKPGLNFGMQGMQYTATSNVAENQALATSLYLHSIPSNNDNQDIVSMGTNAATLCRKVIDNTWEVLTIEALAVVNAMDILGSTSQISDSGKWLHALVRELFPYNDGDNSPSARLIQLKEKLMQTNFEQLFNDTWNHEG